MCVICGLYAYCLCAFCVKHQAAVVDLVKSAGVALNDQFITLAIGDGANDVPMIQRVLCLCARIRQCACALCLSLSHSLSFPLIRALAPLSALSF